MAYKLVRTSSQYLSATNPVSSAPFTMGCWVKFNTLNTSANNTIMSLTKNATLDQLFSIRVSNDGRFSFLVWSGGSYSQPQVLIAATNTWYHVCAVEASSTSHNIFVNGANKTTTTGNITPTGINAFAIGADRLGTPVNYLDAVVCESGIWDVALNDAEVAALGKGMSPRLVRPQNLVFYAPLVRDLTDLRKSLAITNNGTATVEPHYKIYGQ